jgi:protein-tyrosine phosphatase
MATRVLFVCLGNICRSPMAEGVMRSIVAEAGLADDIRIDSAGTGGSRQGDPPDKRASAEALRRGIDLSDIRCRKVASDDFDRFDLLVAMDAENVEALRVLAADDTARARIRMLREFDPASVEEGELEVPDPYYDGPDGFVHVFDLVDAACRGLLVHLQAAGRR